MSLSIYEISATLPNFREFIVNDCVSVTIPIGEPITGNNGGYLEPMPLNCHDKIIDTMRELGAVNPSVHGTHDIPRVLWEEFQGFLILKGFPL